MNMIDGGRKLQPIGQQSDRTLVQVIAAPRNTSSSNPAYITQAAADIRYAPISHTHVISQVIGLQTALDGKASASHNHDASYAPISHAHAISQVTGLQTTLDGKASTSHGHFIADVGGLQTALDSKANSGHGHTIANVTGLQAALDSKAATAHEHSTADISSPFQGGALLMSPAAGQPLSALVPPYGTPGGLLRWSYTSWSFDATSYAISSHNHDASYAPISHAHAISQVTGLQTALDGKLALSGGTLSGALTGTTATFNQVAGGVSGVALLSNWTGGNAATFSYKTFNTSNGYGFLQDQDGRTRVNSSLSVSLCYLGYDRLVVNSNSIHSRSLFIVGGSDGSTIYPGMLIASPVDWANTNFNDSYILVGSTGAILPTPVPRRMIFLDAESLGPNSNRIRVPTGVSWSVVYRDAAGERQYLSAGQNLDIYYQSGFLVGGNDGNWHLLTV